MAAPTYSVTTSNMDGLIQQLNTILADISNRLDAIEGQRGTASIKNRVDIKDDDGNRIGGFTNEAY